MKDLTFSGGDLEAPATLRVDLVSDNSDNTTLLETYGLNDRQPNQDNIQTEAGKGLMRFLKIEHNIRDFVSFAVDNGLSLTVRSTSNNETELLVNEGSELGAVKVENATITERESTGGADKGGYTVSIDFDREIKYIDALDVYLSREGRKLVKNSLNKDYGELNLEAKRISCPFNLGSSGNNSWAWDRGAYPIKGDTVTEEDRPDEVVIVVQSKDQAVSFILPVEDGGDSEG